MQEMNFLEAQKELAEIIKSASAKVNAYYWRLSGDHPNSLCKFLGLEEEELKVILRLCNIYKANSNDAVSKNNFESLMTMRERGPTFDWGKYNVGSKNEQFVKIGQGGGESFRPKNFYDVNGCLTLYPVDENVPNLQTKSQRSLLTKLLIAGGGVASNNKNIEGSDDIIAKPNKKHESPNKTQSLRKACYWSTSKNL